MKIAQHRQRVWAVQRHPQLPYLASASADRTAQVYSTDTFSLITKLENAHERSVRAVAWRPFQPMIALGSFDATISVFAFEDPNWEFLAQLEGHDNEIKSVAFSGCGRYLASCSRDKSVWVWEIDETGEDFECVAVLQDHSQDVKHVAWHQKTTLLASASYDNSVCLYRCDSDMEWNCVCTLREHTTTVWSCDFHPTELRLVSADGEGNLRVFRCTSAAADTNVEETPRLPSVARWETPSEDWELECELPRVHTLPAYSVRWGKNGLIASTGADGRVVIYSEEGGNFKVSKVFEKFHGIYEINSIDWLSETEFVTGGDDGCVRLGKVEV